MLTMSVYRHTYTRAKDGYLLLLLEYLLGRDCGWLVGLDFGICM